MTDSNGIAEKANERSREDNVRLSVQSQPGIYSGFYTVGVAGMYAQTLPSLYDQSRQWYLRRMGDNPQNSLWQSAGNGIARDVASAKWEISGRRRAKYYQDMLINADKGAGWATFVNRLLFHFHSCDDGAVVELIGRGVADKYLPKEQITGIANLDPLYCYFTGNADYPVIYQDPLAGRLHRLHWSRVYRLIDGSRSDPMLRERGFCALSRAIAWVQQHISMQSYIGESLSNEPPPGIVLINGISNKKQWEDAWKLYLAALGKVGAINPGSGVVNYLPVVEYINPDSGKKVTIEFIRFSMWPDGMDVEKQNDIQAKGIASGLNIDVNDFWPISSGTLGNDGQTRVLDKKSKGKTIGFLIGEIDRFMNNRVLPDALRFVSKYKDTEKSLEEAQTAQAHTTVASGIAPYFPATTVANYLVKVVPGLAEVALDENGEIIQADDSDILADEEPAALTVDDTIDEVDAGDVNQTADDSSPIERALNDPGRKDYEEVVYGFEGAMYDAVAGMVDGSIDSRRRAGVVGRGHISKFGRDGMIEGMAEGGVEVETLEGDELETYNALKAEHAAYWSDLTGRIYNDGEVLTEAGIRSTVKAWVKKTLDAFYVAGIAAADTNGLYEFYGDDGDESCADCRRLKGKKFRLKDWIASDYLPSSSSCKLECGGYQCNHGIRRVQSGRSDRKSLIGLKDYDEMPKVVTLRPGQYEVISRKFYVKEGQLGTVVRRLHKSNHLRG